MCTSNKLSKSETRYSKHILIDYQLLIIHYRSSWTPSDAFGYASVISRIVNVFPVSLIAALSQDVLKSFSDIMASLACIFLELTMKKDEVSMTEFCLRNNEAYYFCSNSKPPLNSYNHYCIVR